MSKIIFWLVVVFVALLALRLYNHAQLRKRDGPPKRDTKRPLAEPMVRCARCGVFLPKSESRLTSSGPVCAAGCEPGKK